ncbi:MAG: glycosyltransferase [archaeon]|nr:glycosyltransferase [archaeon]
MNIDLSQNKELANLILSRDFDNIQLWMFQHNIPLESVGENLFAAAKYAMSNQQIETAAIFFDFLLEFSENKDEKTLLTLLMSDLQMLGGKYDVARKYLQELNYSPQNMDKYLRTFMPALALEEMLNVRDRMLSEINENWLIQELHKVVQIIFSDIAKIKMIRDAAIQQYEGNIDVLKQIDPSILESEKHNGNFSHIPMETFPEYHENYIINVHDQIYVTMDGIWQQFIHQPIDKSLYKNDQRMQQRAQNVVYRCEEPEDLIQFLELIQTDDPNFEKNMCFLVVNIRQFSMLMTSINLKPMLSSDYVFRIIDIDNFKTHFTNTMITFSASDSYCLVVRTREDQQFFAHLTEAKELVTTQLLKNIKQYKLKLKDFYTDDFLNTLIIKIRKEPLRILFLTSRYSTYVQYSTRDLSEGFRKLGHAVEILMEEKNSPTGIRNDKVIQKICEFHPDVIVCIDHLRLEFPFTPKNIPFVTWIQDTLPTIQKLSDSSDLCENDIIFSISYGVIDSVSRLLSNHPIYKKKKIHLLPVTADTKIYKPISVITKKYDVTYISHLYHPSETFMPILEGKSLPGVNTENEKRFMIHMIRGLVSLSIEQLWQIIRLTDMQTLNEMKKFAIEVCNNNSMTFSNEFYKITQSFERDGAFGNTIKLLFKTRPIKYLVENGIDVKVFGKNWEKYSGFEKVAMGPVENGKSLNILMNETKINLNLSPGITYHIRAPETLAAKGFMLSRYLIPDNNPITNYFTEGKEVILFKSETDLLKKINYFIINETEREEIALKAYRRFVDNYASDKNALKIIDTIAVELGTKNF